MPTQDASGLEGPLHSLHSATLRACAQVYVHLHVLRLLQRYMHQCGTPLQRSGRLPQVPIVPLQTRVLLCGCMLPTLGIVRLESHYLLSKLASLPSGGNRV